MTPEVLSSRKSELDKVAGDLIEELGAWDDVVGLMFVEDNLRALANRARRLEVVARQRKAALLIRAGARAIVPLVVAKLGRLPMLGR